MSSTEFRQIVAETEGEALAAAQAIAYFRAVKQAGKKAPQGQFLNHAEKIALDEGRNFMKNTLQQIAQEEIDEVEKKNDIKLCPNCHKKMRHRGHPKKNIDSVVGTFTVKRYYGECGPCKWLTHPADTIVGLQKHTLGFRSLVVRAGSGNAFEVGEKNLKAYCGLEVSHMTIRKLCHEESAKVKEWYEESADVPQDFIATKGNVELMIDATKVNTTEGWRDAKIGIYSKRMLGEGVDISYWDKRNRAMLPDVACSVAFASIEEKELFQRRVNRYRSLLRVGSTGDISTLGDGADWIWNISREVFGNVRECLDVYHALEHLSNAGKVLYKEGTKEYTDWHESTKWELLESGFEKIEQRLDELEKEFADDTLEKKELVRLRKYFGNHKTRLSYRERLLEGRVIGSGQVEGACKSMIGKRLKQTNARWCVERLNEMALLCSVHYSDLWEKYWTQAN